jgi:SRSO17 transposase
MNLENGSSERRFAKYVEGLAGVVGHADRAGPLRDYCTGLMLPGERKSVEPMAAKTAPARTAAQHQSLLHFVGIAPWSDADVLAKVRELVLPAIEKRGPIEAWIIDDTAFPKQGTHSVGVHHQYCGQLGKQANCQVAVSLSIANHCASLPVAYRLYLPKAWAEDGVRRDKAGVPLDIGFQTKPELALEQIRWACEAGLPRGVALMDVAYGNDSRLRTGMTALRLTYVAGIQPNTLMWPFGAGPRRRGKPLNNTGRRDEPGLISAKEVTLGLPKRAWRTIRWREGSADWLASRFARVRVGVGHNQLIPESLLQEWLLIARPSRPNTGSRRCRQTSASAASSTLPSCAGVSSAIIRNSSRRSGLVTMKGADGVASIITLRCASRLMASCSPSGRRFPPQDLVPPRCSRRLPYPKVIDPEEPPLRPERHIPNSIATMRARLINVLAKTLPRCPCCGASAPTYRRRKVMTQ